MKTVLFEKGQVTIPKPFANGWDPCRRAAAFGTVRPRLGLRNSRQSVTLRARLGATRGGSPGIFG
jgi:hypothetical protein